MSERTTFTLEDNVVAGFAPLPADWYKVEIEEIEDRTAKSAKNSGKPMYNYKLKVVDGDFSGRKLFLTACLWPEAIFTQYELQVATGLHVKGEKKFSIADKDDLIGKELKVRVALKDKFFGEDALEEDKVDDDGKPIQDNEIKGFRSLSASAGVKKSAGAKARAGSKGFSL